MKLCETSSLMESEDYKERFRGEYIQLETRLNNLERIIVKYEAGKLEFNPACGIEILKRQAESMRKYLYWLSVRALIEEIPTK